MISIIYTWQKKRSTIQRFIILIAQCDMDLIEQYLHDHGPQLSSVIADHLVDRLGISHAAARKRISRKTADQVKRLSLIKFPRNESFLYLPSQFASEWYWGALSAVLHLNNTAYGAALNALISRGGLTLERHFHIISGSPEKQKGHVPSSAVLERLLSAGLVRKLPSDIGGSVISIRRTDLQIEEHILDFRWRLFAEKILIDSISTWLKKLGLVSYGSIQSRDDDPAPKVGTFFWDVTAPTYLSPLTGKSRNGSVKPGFWVCDVHFGSTFDEIAASVFIRKCKTFRALRNVGSCVQMVVASKFSGEAFALLKSNGIVAATIENLFGVEAAHALKSLRDTLVSASKYEFLNSEQLRETIEKLKHVQGERGKLKGTLFEFLIADVVRKTAIGLSQLRLNHIIKHNKEQAEIDVLAYSEGRHVRFIEAKAYNPHFPLNKAQVERWLNHNIKVAYRAAEAHDDWKRVPKIFELWTCAPLDDDTLELVEAEKLKNRNKYQIIVRQKDELILEFNEAKNGGLSKLLKEYFLPERPSLPSQPQRPVDDSEEVLVLGSDVPFSNTKGTSPNYDEDFEVPF